MYDLATKLEHAKYIKEETSMSSIAYLPSGLTSVQRAISSLSKIKKDWGIQIQEHPKNNRTVTFENQLSIQVPLVYWNEFSSKFGLESQSTSVNLSGYLKEAMENDLNDLREELKPAFTQLFERNEFEELIKTVDTWKARFGVHSYLTQNSKIAVSVEYKEKDIQKVISSLVEFYGQDKGNMELFIEAVKNQRPVNTFKAVQDYDFLFGSRIYSKFAHTSMIFEAVMDFAYLGTQSIYFSDKRNEDILQELDGNGDCKVVGNVVYPKNRKFDDNFLKELKTLIEGKS